MGVVMKDRIIKIAIQFLGVGNFLFPLLLFASPLFAQGIHITQTRPTGTAERIYDFNAILDYQPQFIMEAVRDGEVIQAHNSGTGDGITVSGSAPTISGVPLSQETFFCSSDDEENSYLSLGGGGTRNLLDSRGSYHFFKLTDQWRSRRDNLAFYFGVPLVATNCVRYGQKSVLNFPHWREIAATSTSGDTPLRRSMVRNHFQRRNFLADDSNFRYGRYLFQFQDSHNLDENVFGRIAPAYATGSLGGTNDHYQPFFYEPTYVDCPYGREHQKWGFLSPELAKAGAYNSLNLPDLSYLGLLAGGEIDPERWNFYRELLQQSIHLIGARIDQNYWGRLRPRMSFGAGAASWEGNEKEMAGIIVTAWEILKKGVERMPNAPFGGTWERIAEMGRSVKNIWGECGNVPSDLLLYIDRSGSRPKFVFRKDICHDVLSKKAISHAHYNVQPYPNVRGTAISASYGSIVEGGVYENLFTPNRGYRWVVNTETDAMLAEPIDGKVAAWGYGGLIAGFMAEQLCSLHYRETVGEFKWGTPQASAEENLCIMARALVHQTLYDLGHIQSVAMNAEEYNPDPNPNAVNPDDYFIGKNFYYRGEPRALNSIIVAPNHEDMMVIAHNLKNKNPEMARMAAQMVSMCPFLPEPRNASLNGIVQRNPYLEEPAAAPGSKSLPATSIKGRK